MEKSWEARQTQEQRENGEIAFYFYDNIESDTINWWGEKEMSETSANAFLKAIEEAGSVKRIDVYINSLGGSCQEANAIANNLRRYGEKTTAHIDGFACSAASVIACACHTVIMPRNAVMMIHNPWMITSGNAAQLRKNADDLEKLGQAFATVYEEKSGGRLSGERLKALLDAETYLTAEECLEYGLCNFVENFTEYKLPEKKDAKAYGIDVGRIAALAGARAVQSTDFVPKSEIGTQAVQSTDFVPKSETGTQENAGTGEAAPKSPQNGAEGSGDTNVPTEEKNTGKERDFADTAENLLFQFLKSL